ncbi:hypothetical protein [Nocardia vaccinii]|uniref:hypothetical protein n=1 Tax=Nocardia vaccinii TaxID=1822 RepID=UPI000B27DC0F|nr:hypothetical protein [Nocardia vaccinii]
MLTTELGTLDLGAGALVWLPKLASRGFAAGPDGLRYLLVAPHRNSPVPESDGPW